MSKDLRRSVQQAMASGGSKPPDQQLQKQVEPNAARADAWRLRDFLWPTKRRILGLGWSPARSAAAYFAVLMYRAFVLFLPVLLVPYVSYYRNNYGGDTIDLSGPCLCNFDSLRGKDIIDGLGLEHYQCMGTWSDSETNPGQRVKWYLSERRYPPWCQPKVTLTLVVLFPAGLALLFFYRMRRHA
jgi:hypothetical protein